MEHRANADPVAREHQAAARGVPQRNREVAVQLVAEAEALLLVEMDERLGVAAGLEDMPADFEIGAQFDVVENFSVDRAPDAAVFVAPGLAAGAQIDDRQTAVAEADAGRFVIAFRVGPPMRQRTRHASQGRPVHGAFVEMPESRNAAHGLDLSACLASNSRRPGDLCAIYHDYKLHSDSDNSMKIGCDPIFHTNSKILR